MFHFLAAGVGIYIFISLVILLISAGGRYALLGFLFIGGLFLVIIRGLLKKG